MTKNTEQIDNTLLGRGTNRLADEGPAVGLGAVPAADLGDAGGTSASDTAPLYGTALNRAATAALPPLGRAASTFADGAIVSLGDPGMMSAGRSGVDTLAFAKPVESTGIDTLTRLFAARLMGRDACADSHRPLPPAAASRDLRIALILHRIETFSPQAPSRVSLRMGHAE